MTLYYPEEYKNYSYDLSVLEVILNYKFWAEEGRGIYVHSNIWMGNEDDAAISDMLAKYKIINQGGNTLVLENEEYREYVVIHNFKLMKLF